MPTGGFDDGIWDEHQWEAHLDEIERKSEQLRKFIAPDPSGNIPRWITLLQENSDEHEAVDAFIEEELQIEEAYFPGEEEDDWDEPDEFDDYYFDEFDEEEENLFNDYTDDLDEGESWKELSDDYTLSDHGSIETLDIYNEARELAAYILQWSEGIHPKYLSKEYNDFVANILRIGAKLAGGYSFGFEQDFLGGNIVYTKKALYCANDALVLLQDALKKAPFVTPMHYGQLHERVFELRNDIGIYVQELRERFRMGYD